MRDSKSSNGERVSRDLEVECQGDGEWGASQWDKTKQSHKRKTRLQWASDLITDPQKVHTVRMWLQRLAGSPAYETWLLGLGEYWHHVWAQQVMA